VIGYSDIRRNEASTIIDVKKVFGNKADDDGPDGSGHAPASEDSMYADAYADKNHPGYSKTAESASNLACEGCGARISEAEDRYSRKKFGRALCRKCQATA
jgi:hypothetical protein